MTSREGKDTIQQLDKRKDASKKVKIQFNEDSFTNFNVLDENDSVKYIGKIDLEHSLTDECTCDSFYYGMKLEKISEDSVKVESRYMAENGTAFQCKHILRSKSIRKLGLLEEES